VTDRQVSQKRSIFTGDMYLTTYAELAADHFGLGLT